MRIFDATLSTLERTLDVRLARQTVLAGNLANSDTPGFKPKELDFSAAMAAATQEQSGPAAPAARRGDLPITATSASGVSPESFVTDVPGAAPGLDGNAVDLDRTTAAIAENAIQYGAAAKAVAKKLALIRYVASDGQA